MRKVVRIADMEVVKASEGQIVTHALGSCIGVTVYDPIEKVGGLVHFMLPAPSPGKAAENIYMYGASAVPSLFRSAYELGAKKERLIVCSAGAGEMIKSGDEVRIGSRNRTMLRKLLWKNSVILRAEDTGGSLARTMSLDLGTGKVTVTKGDQESVLWEQGRD